MCGLSLVSELEDANRSRGIVGKSRWVYVVVNSHAVAVQARW
jgi:hypothetical protein